VLLVSPTAALCAVTSEDVVERLAGIGIRTSAGKVMEFSEPKSIAPALADPISSGKRLSVGDAALALDPLRGDGIGFALRGALLAQAVLARIDARLRRAFVSHVRGCREHYKAARNAEIWRHEVAEMDMVATGGSTAARKELAFRMQGRDLVSAAHWSADFTG
jgi:flavin-dependent dehydrogenase